MKCLSCGGQLAFRESFGYPINENGVYQTVESATGSYVETGVYCLSCGGGHAYIEIHTSGDNVTVALETNSDPTPVATVALEFSNGIPVAIGADKFVGLLIIDGDRQEIGRFIARPDNTDDWWERVKELSELIKKGDNRASFAEEEANA